MLAALWGFVEGTDDAGYSFFDADTPLFTCRCRASSSPSSPPVPGVDATPLRVAAWNGNIGRLVAELVRAKTWNAQKKPLLNVEK